MGWIAKLCRQKCVACATTTESRPHTEPGFCQHQAQPDLSRCTTDGMPDTVSCNEEHPNADAHDRKDLACHAAHMQSRAPRHAHVPGWHEQAASGCGPSGAGRSGRPAAAHWACRAGRPRQVRAPQPPAAPPGSARCNVAPAAAARMLCTQPSRAEPALEVLLSRRRTRVQRARKGRSVLVGTLMHCMGVKREQNN